MASDASSGHNLADRFAFIGVAFLSVYAALVLVPWAFLAVGLSVAAWMVPLAVLVATGALYLLAGSDRPRTVGLALMIVGSVLLVGVVIALSFYDASVDGRWYHQSAVISLADGWNPISNADPGFVPGLQYVRSYPKGFWIAAAALYELFGSIEVGKSLHVLPLGASFFLTLSLLVRFRVRTGWAVVAAGLAAANPIWILESLSFYLDGQIASLLLVALVSALWQVYEVGNRLSIGALSLSLILLVNLKFTGLFYAGLILLALGGTLLWQRRRVELRRAIAVYAVVLGVAVGVVGFNPYVQNTLDFGNPFYPLYGEGSVDFITDNTPINLRGASQVAQLTYGIFGKPANPIEHEAELTVPFSPSSLSVQFPYTGPGARTAGFGPLFSGALVLASAGLVWVAIRQHGKGARLLVILTVGFLLVTVVAHPEGWWARYTPQLWLVPIVVMVGAWAVNSRLMTWMGAVLGVVLVANLVYVVGPYSRGSIDYRRDIQHMYAPFVEGSEVMALHLTSFAYQAATITQLEEAGVRFLDYGSVQGLPCPSPQPLVNGAGVYCLAGEAG